MRTSNYEVLKSRKGLVEDEIRRVQILQDNAIEWTLANNGEGETTSKMFRDENTFVNLLKAARAYHDALFAFRFELAGRVREIEDSLEFRLLGKREANIPIERERRKIDVRHRPVDVADAVAIAAAGLFARENNANIPTMPENANENSDYIHRSDAIPMQGSPVCGEGSEIPEPRRSLSHSEIAKDCGE